MPLMWETSHGASNVVINAVPCQLCGKRHTVPVKWSYGPYHAINHYEILTLKITQKIFVTLKEYGNHTEKYLQRKSQ